MKTLFQLASVLVLGLFLGISGCDWGGTDSSKCEGTNCSQDNPEGIDFNGDGLVDEDPTAPEYAGLWDDSTEVTADALKVEDKDRIAVLRDTIYQGLEVGQVRYLETISLALMDQGLAPDYESTVEDEGFADGLAETPEDCPFVKYYENGFTPTGFACEYLVDMAKTELYSELVQVLDDTPLPDSVEKTGLVTHEEAKFWQEQGAISGIEENRVLVRGDIKKRGFCNVAPTPIQSSYEKGVLVGRQLFAQKFNDWLKEKGYTPDYPVMSKPIEVCNADQTMLNPAHKAALSGVDAALSAEPLCEEFEADNQEEQAQYAQAKIDYKKGVESGVNDEFALAAVKVFKVIPCAVHEPLVVDLDGDGIELTPVFKGVNFDLWGTNSPHAMSWVGLDDGFLVRDLNGNGQIENGMEMFGNINNAFDNGFEMLAELDSDRNGIINAADKAFSTLRIWKDNGNAVTEAGELLSLESVKLSAISLNAETKRMVISGNIVDKVVSVNLNGKASVVGDAFLRTAPYASVTASR